MAASGEARQVTGEFRSDQPHTPLKGGGGQQPEPAEDTQPAQPVARRAAHTVADWQHPKPHQSSASGAGGGSGSVAATAKDWRQRALEIAAAVVVIGVITVMALLVAPVAKALVAAY